MRTNDSTPAAHNEAAARLYQGVLAGVSATPAPSIRTARRMWIAISVACAATFLIVIAASQLVYGEWAAGLSVAIASRSSVLAVGAATLLLASMATLAAVWRKRGGFGLPHAALAASAVLVTPVYAIFSVVFVQHVPSEAVLVSPWGARCLAIAALVGFIVLVAFGWALRRAAPEATATRAAAIGACAGAWVGVAVFLFCPSADQQHLLLGHVLPVAVLTVVGALLLPKELRP
jgi:hypothetical protein